MTRLSQTDRDRLIAKIERRRANNGESIVDACEAEGVVPGTYQSWIRRRKLAELAAGHAPPSPELPAPTEGADGMPPEPTPVPRTPPDGRVEADWVPRAHYARVERERDMCVKILARVLPASTLAYMLLRARVDLDVARAELANRDGAIDGGDVKDLAEGPA